MAFIKKTYPENITEEDKVVFDNALVHEVAKPRTEIFKMCLWNSLLGIKMTGTFKLMKALISVALFRKKIYYFHKAGWPLDKYSKNYFHWFNDVLPRILFLKDKYAESEIVIDSDCLKINFINESLYELGINVRGIHKHSILFCKELLIPKVGESGVQDQDYFAKVQNLFLKELKLHPPTRKVFISRQNSGSRRIINSDEVEKIMMDYDFEIIHTEDYSLKEQIALFTSVSHIVGVHGAGLTNMMFMQKGTKVLEVRRSDDIVNYCYFFLAASCKLKYYYQLATGSGKSKIVQGDDLYIDLLKLRINLDSFVQK